MVQKILAVGGGSGGHVTPVVAVLRELKQRQPEAELRFWCDKKFEAQARSIISRFDDTIAVSVVRAGKLRRYNNLSIIRQLLRPISIVLPNIRDAGLTLIGILQAIVKLLMWRPDVVFCKGGYVCLPVGLAAYMLRIPLVIHDSDAHPGLTNRLLARFASRILTGAPLSFYHYNPVISRYVGIPIADSFRPYDSAEKMAVKLQYGFDPKKPLVVATGGGLGAQRINNSVIAALPKLLQSASVLLISGSGPQYEQLIEQTKEVSNEFRLEAFVAAGMDKLFGASDLVITRAGATTLLELAASAAPTLIIPNGYLTGGHQLKNAAVYQSSKAAVVLDEETMMRDSEALSTAVLSILSDNNLRRSLSRAIHAMARPEAAVQTAETILEVINHK